MLDGKLLPWLASATHIGHELHESGSMDLDTKMKKAEFIGKSTEIRETFNFASPVEVLKAVKLFACDLYGAMLWDLQGDLAEQVFNAWNTCIKLAWNVPRGTHIYILKQLLDCGISQLQLNLYIIEGLIQKDSQMFKIERIPKSSQYIFRKSHPRG